MHWPNPGVSRFAPTRKARAHYLNRDCDYLERNEHDVHCVPLTSSTGVRASLTYDDGPFNGFWRALIKRPKSASCPTIELIYADLVNIAYGRPDHQV